MVRRGCRAYYHYGHHRGRGGTNPHFRFRAEQSHGRASCGSGIADIIKSLWEKAHPTVKFIDQMVTFNAMEETTHELSIHSAVFYAAAKNKMYKAALYLYADGRLSYNVVEA